MIALADARRIADSFVKLMAPACERIEIAGSIRRCKPHVKDIELVLIPRWSEDLADQGSLFAPATVRRNELLTLLRLEIAACREIVPIKAGGQDLAPSELRPDARYWRLWLSREEVKVDVFLVDRHRWGLIHMIRTGSGVGPDGTPATGFAPAMLARWKRITGGGFAREGQLHRPGDGGRPVVVPTPEEREVFAALQMNWVRPERRTSSEAVP